MWSKGVPIGSGLLIEESKDMCTNTKLGNDVGMSRAAVGWGRLQ